MNSSPTRLGDVVDLIKDAVLPAALGKKLVQHYSLPAFDNGRHPVFEAALGIQSNKYLVTNGDVLFSKLNPHTPRIWPIHDVQLLGLASTEFLVLRRKEDKIENGFLEYLLASPEVLVTLQGMVTGTSSSHQRIRPDDLLNVQVCIPLKSEQKNIANILGTLDDKIDLNRRMNETLEAMARAIFKDWFVDFGPTRAKMEGRPPYLAPDLWALFPDHLGEDGLPVGWEMQRLGDLVDVTIGRTPPRKEQEHFTDASSGYKWISIRDLGECGMFVTHTSEGLTNDAVQRFRVPIIPEGTVVVSFKLTVGRVAITAEEMLSNEAIAHLRPPSGSYLSKEYLYFLMKTFDYNTLGSTSSIATAVNSESIRGAKVIKPEEKAIEAFTKTVLPLVNKILSNQSESDRLVLTRDILLPKLMTGEVRVESHIINFADALRERALRSCRERGYVDVSEICREQCIVTFEDQSLTSRAELRFENNSFLIYTRSKQDYYSIAHELAHWATDGELIKQHGIAARKGESSMSPAKEAEADSLAADILMPESFIKEYLGDVPTPDDKLVKKLQKQLRVTEPAMHYRLGNLGYTMPYKSFKNSDV